MTVAARRSAQRSARSEQSVYENFSRQKIHGDLFRGGNQYGIRDGAGKDRLTREGGEYITDIGFDIYGAFGDYYLDLWDEMTQMFEGMDKNYWRCPW